LVLISNPLTPTLSLRERELTGQRYFPHPNPLPREGVAKGSYTFSLREKAGMRG